MWRLFGLCGIGRALFGAILPAVQPLRTGSCRALVVFYAGQSRVRFSDFRILAMHRCTNFGLETGRSVPRNPTESIARVRSILYRIASIGPCELSLGDRVTCCRSEFSHSDIPSLIVASSPSQVEPTDFKIYRRLFPNSSLPNQIQKSSGQGSGRGLVPVEMAERGPRR